MLSLPSAAEPLLMSFSIAFTEPTFRRMLVLAVGAILARGRRTVTAMLRSAGPLPDGHFSAYHRVFSRAAWSLWPLGRVLAQAVLRRLNPAQPVLLIVDDTTAQHRGKQVYGKGRHYDAVRSTSGLTVWRWGHRWVVLAVSVRFPFTRRRWALPVLAALYRPEALNTAEGRRHKTPPQLARQLMAVLIRWFPARKFILLGDGGYASHELARFCHRHRRHVTLVSRFHKDANLYLPPPTRRKGRPGRPRVKGRKLPRPSHTLGAAAVRGGPRSPGRRHGDLVRGRVPARRVDQRRGWLVPQWPRPGAGALGSCARRARHPPRRVLLCHRPGQERPRDHQPVHGPLAH